MTLHREVRAHSAPQDIFFIHGNMASKHWWYPTLEVLTNYFNKSEKPLNSSMILGEFPGHGRSPMVTPLSVENIVSGFIEIAENTGLKKALLVGHSAGGLIAALLLARRPDLFHAGLLISPVGATGLTDVPADIEARYQMITGQRAIATQVISATIYNNNPENEFFKTKIMDDAMATLEHCGVQLVKALMNVDYRAEIKTLQKPLKVFIAAHDWVLKPENAQSYKDLVAGCELVSLPDNGHCLLIENPERTAQEIIAFIDQVY